MNLANIENTQALSSEQCISMAKHVDMDVRAQVARSPLCPVDILSELAHDRHPPVLIQVAKNPACPVEAYQHLIEHRSHAVLTSCCYNHGVTHAQMLPALTRLSNEHVLGLRELAYSEGELPHATLTFLASCQDLESRLRICTRGDLPLHLLTQLAGDGQPAIRASIIDNPNITSTLLVQLLNDTTAQVKTKAACADKLPVELVFNVLSEENIQINRYIARHHKDQDVLALLYQSDPDRYRYDLAQNTHTPAHILELLLKQVNTGQILLQTYLANNKSAPIHLLAQLALGTSDLNKSAEAIWTLRQITPERIEMDVSQGLTLNKQITDVLESGRQITLGDCLLEIGMNDLYQQIQAAELECQVRAATSNQVTVSVPAYTGVKKCF